MRLAYDRDHALNAICPYFTMFPLEYPWSIVRRHRRARPTVIDPFCGRGTTLYAARRFGLISAGFDTSAIAEAIARAKIARASLDAVLGLAEELLAREPTEVPEQPFFRHAYAPRTLREIVTLREGLASLGAETDVSALLRAAVLGCLHGPRAKDRSRQAYLSNQMSRTFASKPDYSLRYWREKGLEPPDVRAIDVLRRKLTRIPALDGRPEDASGSVVCADARSTLPHERVDGPVLAITSPPYYGMRTYVPDQWLRAWFLGGPTAVAYQGHLQIRHSSPEDYAEDLASVWTNLRALSNEVHLHVRIGSVPSVSSDARALMRRSLELSGGWSLVDETPASGAGRGRRQADQMRGGSAPAPEYDYYAQAA